MKRTTAIIALAILVALMLGVAIGASYLNLDQPAAAAATGESEDTPIHKRLAFNVASGGDALPQTVVAVSANSRAYVFLPAYTDMANVTVTPLTDEPLTLGGTRLEEGMSCADFPLNEALRLDGGELGSVDMIFMPSANVPALFVDTASGDMTAIHADKTQKEAASLTLVNPDGSVDYRTAGTDKIRGHGHSSWVKKKKSYNLYLDGDAGLLGMGAAEKWILISNVFDESCVRNWMVYTVAKEIGTYPWFAPDCRFVDLYLNGRYNGLYLLCEKVEIHPSRLNIDSHNFLFDIEQDERWDTLKNPVSFGPGIAVEIKNPSNCTDGGKQLLQQHLADFQAALLAEDGRNPRTGQSWLDYIDLDSFVRKYLIEEVFQNYDAGSCSQYYYWDISENIIYAGPCWDYDLILGNHKQKDANNFLAQREWKTPDIYTPWFGGLWQHEEFREYALELYRTEFRPLLTTMMEEQLPAKLEELETAIALNETMWRSFYEGTPSLTGSLEDTLAYMDAHFGFLDSAWIDGVDYKTIRFQLDSKHQYKFYCLPAGSSCKDIPLPSDYGLDPKYAWFNPDGTLFDFDTVLTEDLFLRAHDIAKAKKTK